MTRAMRMRRLWAAMAASALPAALAAQRAAPTPPPTEAAAVGAASAIETVVRALHTAPVAPHDAALIAMITRFYGDRRFASAWTNARGFTVNGEALQRAIWTADQEGLDSAVYPLPSVASSDTEALARADVRLSLVALRFAQDLGWGVTIPGDVHRDHAFPQRAFRGDSLLHAWRDAPDAGRALLDVAPQAFGYQRLRDALRQLRAIEQRGGWESLSPGPALRRGTSGHRVGQLRRLLQERGDLAQAPAATDDAERFDSTLAAAVARFQERHGLLADSVVGGATTAALNVSAASRIAQLQLGMERARWLPPATGGRWITVNLADYHAFVFDEGVPVFRTRVIIGTTTNKTPMFVDTLTNIVFNPAWNVPPSIAAKEILPKLRRDPSYLARNHMVRTNGGIQQLPGPWNALGQVAFMFPNRFNVYMHDTPARELFEAPDRAHSHGCIRVQRPRELAALLLAHEGWSPAAIDSVIATGQRTVTWLRRPIPVRITYATAFSDDDGVLQFRPDVYGRDALLQRAMRPAQGRPLPAVLR